MGAIAEEAPEDGVGDAGDAGEKREDFVEKPDKHGKTAFFIRKHGFSGAFQT
jgi:hypothetical protein